MSEELCRDFENGKCTRGERCRFYHPKLLICKDFQNKECKREKCRFLHVTKDEEETYNNGGGLPDHIDEDEAKRLRKMEPDFGGGGGMYGKRRRDDGFNFNGTSGVPTVLMEENEILKRKVLELQRQVMDLRQMNDTLYDQNTRFRNQIRGVVAPPQDDQYNKVGTTGMPVGGPGLMGNRNGFDFTAVGS